MSSIIHSLIQFVLLYNYHCSVHAQEIYRLPTTIKPIHYDLDFYPKFTEPTYELDGNSHMLINISRQHVENEDTDLQSPLLIQLNIGPNMTIIESHMNFTQLNDTNIEEIVQLREYNNITEIVTFYYNATNEKVLNYLTNNDSSHPSTYILAHIYLQFQYEMQLGGLRGLYISSYHYQPTNVTVRNAVSSLGLQYARYAFPCFDEPSFKAEFDIDIYGPVNATILSNGAIESEIPESPFVTACTYEYINGQFSQCKDVKFETTPVMSSYIISLIIGSYDNISAIDENSVIQSVYMPIGENEHAEFALDIGMKILPYFQEILNYEYPLNKMDNIALTQFPWGALENLGAIVYRRSSILSDVHSSDRQLGSIATLISHEYAHQWFGNIVTCAWWDDTWLNEGFASFFGYDAAHIFYPQLQVYPTFLISINGMMSSDASIFVGTTIGVDVHSQSDVLGMFSGLQYQRGGAILRMSQNFMGNSSFYGALQEYITTYQYDVATSDDLFNILNVYTDNTGLMAESFTRHAGIPVVYMSIEDITSEEITFNFRQQRLVKEGPGFYDSDNNDYGYSNFSRYFDDEELIQQFAEQRWWIVLKIDTIEEESQVNELMNDKEYSVTLDRVSDGNDEYYLLNSELKNYFRVNYDNELLNMIKRSWDLLSFWNQFNIIADRYELMTYSYASAVSYLQLLDDTMKKESDNSNDYLSYLVWNIIIDSLYTIDDRFCVSDSNNKALRDFRKYAENLLKPLYKDLNGYEIDENDSANVLNLRNSVIMALIRFEDNNVINDGINVLNDLDEITVDEFGYIEGINGNILQAVITAGIASMDTELYDLFFQLYRVSNGVQRGYIRSAFSTLYNDNNIVMETYDSILRGYSDSNGMFEFSASNKVNALDNLATCAGTGYVWDQLTAENENNEFNGTDWEMLFTNGTNINTLIAMVNTFATTNRYDEIYRYYYGENGDLHREDNNERIINQTLETIAMNTMWLINNEGEMEKFLVEDDDDGLEGWVIALIVIGCIVFCVIVVVFCYCSTRRGSGSRFKDPYTQMTSDRDTSQGYGAADTTGNRM